jgi:hypothetical protein
LPKPSKRVNYGNIIVTRFKKNRGRGNLVVEVVLVVLVVVGGEIGENR